MQVRGTLCGDASDPIALTSINEDDFRLEYAAFAEVADWKWVLPYQMNLPAAHGCAQIIILHPRCLGHSAELKQLRLQPWTFLRLQ